MGDALQQPVRLRQTTVDCNPWHFWLRVQHNTGYNIPFFLLRPISGDVVTPLVTSRLLFFLLLAYVSEEGISTTLISGLLML